MFKMAQKAQDWLGRILSRGVFFLQSQPRMGFQRLLGAIAVVVEELLTGADGVLGDEDQSGDLPHHHDLRHAVGADPAVVHQTTISARLTGSVDTEIELINERSCWLGGFQTHQYCFPLCLK